ncbi:Calcium-binding ef hand family protein [Thalictrum thalictroides]|uniref:Calcium-binding ef hand family protein n=1 Tax=Thalictrum thalictroides TaxID=46969 RepID=A0A7J6WZ31_THATH|nr:Calcium-binding ef hand family protein [Thalictrum thalictroides]
MDGGLNTEEFTSLIVATNPSSTFSEEKINTFLDGLFMIYNEFIDGDKGLTYEGLLRIYNDGVADVDHDFDALQLQDASPEVEKDFDALRLQDASPEIEKDVDVLQLGPKPYSYQDLDMFTAKFSEPIGFGGYREVYQG